MHKDLKLFAQKLQLIRELKYKASLSHTFVDLNKMKDFDIFLKMFNFIIKDV